MRSRHKNLSLTIKTWKKVANQCIYFIHEYFHYQPRKTYLFVLSISYSFYQQERTQRLHHTLDTCLRLLLGQQWTTGPLQDQRTPQTSPPLQSDANACGARKDTLSNSCTGFKSRTGSCFLEFNSLLQKAMLPETLS